MYCVGGIDLLWKGCDIRPVLMASWNRGFCSPLLCSCDEITIMMECLYEELFVGYQHRGLVYWFE